MTDISRIWISKTSKWNNETKTIDYFYKCELQVEGQDGISINLDITDNELNKVYEVISPLLKKALKTNIEALPDEL